MISPSGIYIELTKELIAKNKLYGTSITFQFDFKKDEEQQLLDSAFDTTFFDVARWKGGELLPWRHWLLASGFPIKMYKESGYDLMKMMKDERCFDEPSTSQKSHHNFFGDTFRKRRSLGGKSYLDYLLPRLKDAKARAMPHFYFDVVAPAWIWQELIRNPKQVKTTRSALVCCPNVFFRWNKHEDKIIVGWVLKHCDWSHLYQDIFSPILWGKAICKELGWDGGIVNVFFVSLSMDNKKKAKQLIKTLEGSRT